MAGEDCLSLVTEPGPETGTSGYEHGYEIIVVVGGLNFVKFGSQFSPGEAVRKDACIFSLDTIEELRVVTSASRVDLSSVSATFSRMSISVKIEVLDLGDEGVNIVEVEAHSAKAI